jgi:hypothetical protein
VQQPFEDRSMRTTQEFEQKCEMFLLAENAWR